MKKPKLYIFSGLPASGKSTIAKKLVNHINATYIRIDTIEQGLRDVCNLEDLKGDGYRLSYRIVTDNLILGNDVVADSVNPWELTRNEWNEVATSIDIDYINIEVICSDLKEHRKRVENRKVEVNNLKLPTWEEVLNRDYHPWKTHCIQIDTAGKNIDDSFHELLMGINDIHVKEIEDSAFSHAQKFYSKCEYTKKIENSDRVVAAYLEKDIIGVSRIAFENEVTVLRGMQVDRNLLRRGIGILMLKELDKIIGDDICYCIPHDWLETFYQKICFKKIDIGDAPTHLQNRLRDYLDKYPQLIMMRKN